MKLPLFLVAVVLCISDAFASDHWGYPDLDLDEEFPPWGGVCDSGTRQSPINLSAKGALKGDFDELQFENYDDEQDGVMLINNGHTIQLYGFTDVMKLAGGPLKDTYVVEQVHLHWWSEHTIDNIRYPLEAHIVHRNARYPNMTAAVDHSDGVAVISVLYHVSNHENPAIEEILESLDDVKSYSQINKPVAMKSQFAVDDLFPDITGYMTYAGSLTTPSCAESVTWIVLSETFPITLEQVAEFKEVEYEEGKYMKNNYRSIQKTNNRPVIVVLEDDDDDDDDDDNNKKDHDDKDSAASLSLFSFASMLTFILSARFVH